MAVVTTMKFVTKLASAAKGVLELARSGRHNPAYPSEK